MAHRHGRTAANSDAKVVRCMNRGAADWLKLLPWPNADGVPKLEGRATGPNQSHASLN
jgi:hypothetical protein